jgi:hypothetical protein
LCKMTKIKEAEEFFEIVKPYLKKIKD